MPRYLLSVDTMFWVDAKDEAEADEKALECMPLSDLEFMTEEVDESEDEE